PTKADQRLRGRRDGQSARLTKTRTKPDTTGTARITSKDVVLSCRVRRVRAVSAPSRAYHSPRPGPASRSKGRNLLCTLPRVSRKFLKNQKSTPWCCSCRVRCVLLGPRLHERSTLPDRPASRSTFYCSFISSFDFSSRPRFREIPAEQPSALLSVLSSVHSVSSGSPPRARPKRMAHATRVATNESQRGTSARKRCSLVRKPMRLVAGRSGRVLRS